MSRIALLKPHGHFEMHDLETGALIAGDTLQCCHCYAIITVEKGFVYGWCSRCNAKTCGPMCPAGVECIPKEAMLENMEAGLPMNHPRPIIVQGVDVPRE